MRKKTIQNNTRAFSVCRAVGNEELFPICSALNHCGARVSYEPIGSDSEGPRVSKSFYIGKLVRDYWFRTSGKMLSADCLAYGSRSGRKFLT